MGMSGISDTGIARYATRPRITAAVKVIMTATGRDIRNLTIGFPCNYLITTLES